MNHWNIRVNHIWCWFFYNRRFKINTAGLRVKAVNETSFGWGSICTVFEQVLLESISKAQWIDGDFEFSGMDLKYWGKESLWEEKCGNPIHFGFFIDSSLEKFNSFNKFLKPGSQRLEWRISFFLPRFGDLIVGDGVKSFLEFLIHNDLAFESRNNFFAVSFYKRDKFVKSCGFLHKVDFESVLVFLFLVSPDYGWNVMKESFNHWYGLV